MSDILTKSHPGLNTYIVDLLECPVCMETCVPPIKCCIKGHNICHVCEGQITECPICREKYSGTRNFMAEQLYEKMKEDSEKQSVPKQSNPKDEQKHKPAVQKKHDTFMNTVQKDENSFLDAVQRINDSIKYFSIQPTRKELRLSARKDFLSTNLIKNHSGTSGFEYWTNVKNGGTDIQVQNPPVGSNPLPKDDMFPDSNICFQLSNGASESEFRQIVDLWEHGFGPETLLNLIPFRIEVTEKYTARYHFGGTYTLSVVIGEEKGKYPLSKKEKIIMTPTGQWKTMQFNFDFEDNHSCKEIIKNLRCITFTHGGRGVTNTECAVKMAHASLRIVLL